MEGLKEIEANITVQIHPSKSKSVLDAILGELSSLLFTYNETFQGVVLAYDPTDLSTLAKVLPGIHPYLGVTLKAKLLIFYPKPNSHIDAQVVKITPNSIHLVVLGFSSAFIAREDIRDEFMFKCKDGDAASAAFVSRRDKKHKIRPGTLVRFLVKCFDAHVLHFSGSMVDGTTGSVKWLDNNVGKWDQPQSSDFKTKNKDHVLPTNKKKKKKKKRKLEDDFV